MRAPAAILALVLAGCTADGTQDRFLAKYADPEPARGNVLVCHGYGCRLQDRVDLRAAWAGLVAPLAAPAPDAAEERRRIAAVIAAFEGHVGSRTRTAGDVGGTFAGFGQDGQLDCIDEAANTTTYLTLLERAGLLAWHEVRAPMSRGFFVNGWPHTSAVIAETAGGGAFAVDAWFHSNGAPAEIVGLDEWLGGWNPEGVETERVVAVSAAPAHIVVPPREP